MHRSLAFGGLSIVLTVGQPVAGSTVEPLRSSIEERAKEVLASLAGAGCQQAEHGGPKDSRPQAIAAWRGTARGACRVASRLGTVLGRTARRSSGSAADLASGPENGTLLGRARMGSGGSVAVDVVAYASSGLIVGGVLCYPEGARGRTAVIHLAAGVDGTFSSSPSPMLQTCIDWALMGRVAFIPSPRGQDGAEGHVELCLGEAGDVAAGAVMLRSLEEIDPNRLALVGGSLGGCLALRASVLIPNLRAVVAFVPPTDWKDLVQYHRTNFTPATETRCDGSTFDWTLGGPALADAFDSVICGRAGCSDADYRARSPLPDAMLQTSPTLVMTAEDDNLVPVEQQRRWGEERREAGHAVESLTVDPCDPLFIPPLAMDVEVHVSRAYHFLSPSALVSGLIFLIEGLDGPGTANH